MKPLRTLMAALAMTALVAAPGLAQTAGPITQADIQRLQDNVYLADRDVSQLRTRDATRANQLLSELDDLRDEVVYLKVKLRKEKALGRGEYADLRKFIYELERAPEFVIIDDVTLTEGNEREALTLRIDLSTYYNVRANGS